MSKCIQMYLRNNIGIIMKASMAENNKSRGSSMNINHNFCVIDVIMQNVIVMDVADSTDEARNCGCKQWRIQTGFQGFRNPVRFP